MKENNTAFRFKAGVATLIVILIIYSLLSVFIHKYTRLTADSMLYFSIAEKYLNGDYANAINGYWGPLLAWLLIPFLYFGFSNVFAINAIDLLLGIFTITGIWILSYRFEISEKIRSIILIALCPIILRVSIVQPMDFLLLCILVYYLCIVFKSDYPNKMLHGVLCGLLGALAYFTKAYAFPFFIAHFLIMNILHYFRNSSNAVRKNILKNALTGFILFFLVSGIWIMTISNKYGYYTFSTMRSTNFNAPGPEAMGGGLEFGVPIFNEGFFEPPNKTAFVVWEDPSYIRGKKWSPWESWGYFKHFIRLCLKNIAEGLLIFESFSTLSIAIVIAYILSFSAQSKDKLLARGDLLYPLFTIALFTGGYIMFHFEQRYLWLSNILLLLMGGHILYELFQRDLFRSSLRKGILTILFIVSFIFTPSRHVLQASKSNIEQDMYYISTDLKQYNIKGNIASNREYVPIHDAWHKTFRLAYWLNSRYYGQAKENISDEELGNELKKYGINYYFFWGASSHVPQFLNNYKELTNGEIPDLKIYSLEESEIPQQLR
ncbi:MAG: hypothetical protein HZC48_07590 [Nitrospirae bacterium]|nr:hypothetical protein [Nitrospirota bacterium]